MRKDDLIITPELQACIDEVEMECRDGKCVTCSTTEELHKYLESLH